MDKLEKLYNLYLKEGIISNATSFEKWKAADSIKQEKLFEIGKSKGLFKTSTVDKFKAAWGEAAIPTVKKKDEGMVSPSEDGSLDSSETDVISQEDLLQQTVTPSDQLETKPTDTQVDFELGFQNIPEQQLTEKLVSTPSEEKDDFAGTILSEQPPKAFSEPVVQDGVSVAKEVEYDPFKESVDRVVNKELLTNDLSSFLMPLFSIFTEADATEENVIPQMQYYFEEYGFDFEPADALGDGMTVKASNGKQTYVNLDGVFGGEQAAKDLKKFLIENKEENAVERESNKVIAENSKIYKEQEINDVVTVFNTEAQEWNNNYVEFIKLKESNEQMAKELVGMSQSDIESDPILKQKLDMYTQNLDAEKQLLKLVTDKSEEFKVKGARLDMLAGEYYEMKSKQGSYSSGIMAGIFGRGPANIASGAVSYGVDAYTYLAKNRSLTEEKYRDELIRIGKEEGYLPKDEDFSGVSKEEIIERLGGDTNDAKPFFDRIFLAGKQALGFDPIGKEAEKEALGEPTNFDKVNDKVKDYARKGIKYYNDYGVEGLDYDKAAEGRYRNPFSQIAANLDTEMGIVDASLASGEKISEKIGAPKEWADLEKQSFWGGAILGLSESIPAMVGGMDKIGFVQRTAQMFMMTSSHLEQEMNKNPMFDNISESEKIPIKVGLSSVVAVLESLGFRNVMSKNAYIPTLILSRVLKKVPKGSTQRTLREYIQQDVESSIARGGYSLLAAGAAEFETGFAQEAADILIKNIYNDLKEKEMFETPESWGDIVFQMVYAGGQEAVGGFILGSPGAIASAVAGRQDVQSLDERDWKNFELLSNDPTYDKMYVQKLKAEIADPENSKTLEEAQAELDSVRKIQGLLKNNKQNISNLSAEKKKRAVQLLIQQQKLKEEIDNGNKQLSKSKRELLDDVNKELENLGVESRLIEISERAKEGGIQEFKGSVIDWIKGLGKTKDIGDVMEGGIEIDMDGTKVIMTESEGGVTLESIETPDADKGKGKAEAALKKIAENADRDGVKITLKVVPKDATVNAETTQQDSDVEFDPKYFDMLGSGKTNDTGFAGFKLYQGKGQNNRNLTDEELNILDQLVNLYIEQVAKGNMTIPEVIAALTRRGYALELPEWQQLRDYIASVTNPNVPKIGNNKDSFTDWRQKKVNGELRPSSKVKKTKTVDAGRLENLYGRNGFEMQEDGVTMVRTPKVQELTQEQKDVEAFFAEDADDDVDRASDNLSINRKNEGESQSSIYRASAITSAKFAANAIKKILPNVRIVLHEAESEYLNYVTKPKDGEDVSSGEYKDNVIHINLSKVRRSTVAHEVFHAVLLDKVRNNDALAKKISDNMVRVVQSKLPENDKLRLAVENHAKKYDGEIQSEEQIAELIGLLSSNIFGYTQLDSGVKAAIKNFLINLAKKLRIPLPKSWGSDQEVVDLINTLARKTRTGEEITEEDVKLLDSEEGGEFLENPANVLRQQKVGNFEITYTENDKIAQYIKDGRITEPKNILDIFKDLNTSNVEVLVHSPDDMLAGEIKYMVNGKLETIFEGSGGVFFVTKFGEVWASTEDAANQIVKGLNKQVEEQGKGFMLLTKGTDQKLMSSPTGVDGAMKVIDKMVGKNKIFSPSEFRTAVSKAVSEEQNRLRVKAKKDGKKAPKFKPFSLRKSAEKMMIDITTLFSDESSGTFETRGNIVRGIGNALASAKLTSEQELKAAKFLGGDTARRVGVASTVQKKTGNPLSQGLSDLIALTLAEKLTKGLKTGDVYAVIEVNQKVKTIKSKHPSYDTSIVTLDGKPPTLHLLKNRQPGKEVLTPIFGKNKDKPYSVGQVPTMTGQINLEKKADPKGTDKKTPTTRQQRTDRLAPNGKRSNLTDVQYDIVRTPEFKNWFGDWETDPENASKVVDENGEPMVTYHGSASVDITQFDRRKKVRQGSGLKEFADYFTSNRDLAEIYKSAPKDNKYVADINNQIIELEELIDKTKSNSEFNKYVNEIKKLQSLKYDGEIYEVFLNIRDPLTFNGQGLDTRGFDNLKLDLGYKVAIGRTLVLEALSGNNTAYTNTKYDGVIGENIADFSVLISGDEDLVRKKAKPYLGNVYATLNPTQIKSADGSNTTFDPSKPSIRQQKGIQQAMENGEVIQTDSELIFFKGMQPKMKNGKPFSVHKIKKGSFAALDKNIALDYKGDKPLKQFTIPEGTTVEVVNLPSDEISIYRRNEEKAIDASDAQVVKLVTIDSRGKSQQYVIKDDAILKTSKDVKEDSVTSKKKETFTVRQQKGLINFTEKDAIKFSKIGVNDARTIQAMNSIGLSGVKFTEEGVNKKIKETLDKLYEDADNYLLDKDSQEITRLIQFEIDAAEDRGDSEREINFYKSQLTDGDARTKFILELKNTQEETADQWVSYLKESDYSDAFKYLMLDAVLTHNYDLKSLKYKKRTNTTTRNISPFDAGTLAMLYASDSKNLLKSYVEMQKNNLDNIINASQVKSTEEGKWLKFDGGPNAANLQETANSLSQLVQDTYWCTKTNALGQLKGGDFYVYVTGKTPRIAIRMEGDRVGEVRGNASSKQDLEGDMLPVADKFLKDNIPNDSGKKWLDSIAFNKKAKELLNNMLTDGIGEKEIKEYVSIISEGERFNTDYGENGFLTKIKKEFKRDNIKPEVRELVAFGFTELNPKTTKYLIGNLDLRFTEDVYSITDLGNLELISGNAYFRDTDITSLGNLKFIGGTASFSGSKITSLGNLKTIGGVADFIASNVTDLGKLETIGGNAYFRNSNITDLGNLKSIGRAVDFRDTNITDLGNLKTIGGSINLRNSKITSLGNLESIGGFASFNDSNVTDLGNLKFIGGNASFSDSKVTSLGNLKSIGGKGYFIGSKVTSLGNLESIGGKAYFSGSKITSLGNLKFIGGAADFRDSNVTDLGNLESIGGDADFYGSKITDLGNLESIGGGADFRNSNITDLGNLESIGGGINFGDNTT